MYRCLECDRVWEEPRHEIDEFGREIDICNTCGGAIIEDPYVCSTCTLSNDYVIDDEGYEVEEPELQPGQLYCKCHRMVVLDYDEACPQYKFIETN